MTNKNIDLPSKRVKGMYDYGGNLMIEIEKPLRRDFRTEKDTFWKKFWGIAVVAFIALMFMTGFYLLVGTVVDHQSQRALINKAQAAECMENVASYPMSTSSLVANLKELCA